MSASRVTRLPGRRPPLLAALAGLGEFFETLHEHHFGASTLSLHQKARAISGLMRQHEQSMCALLLDALTALPVRIIGKPTMGGREANVSLLSEAHPSLALATLLAEKDIVASAAHFYAYRLIQQLGIDPDDGVLRISFAPYNTKEETLRLIAALVNILGS